jgi:hypothetical protein
VSGDPVAVLKQLRSDLGITNPDDTGQLVAAFFDQIGLPAKWRPWLAPFVRNSAREILRNAVRKTEKSAPLPGTPGTSSTTTTTTTKKRHKKADPQAERRKALGEHFFNGAKWVTWGTATIDDHEGCVAFLTKQRDGVDGTIQRHLDAIAMLRSAGAACLDDLEPAAS